MMDIAITRRIGALTLDVAFEAPAGLTAIFGPSGAGKTSILRAVAGLAPLDRGHIRVDGIELDGLATRARRIGYVFQDARLFPHMTVAQNLAYGGTHDRDRIIDLLALEPLLSRKPGGLSGGEARRVAIGRALMSNPRLLLLDEPLSGLDTARKAEVMPYLERLRDDAGLPILFVSHDMAEVSRLATTLVLLRAGQVAAAGPADDLLCDPKLIPLIGIDVAGAVLQAQVSAFDAEDGVTTLEIAAARLVVPGRLGQPGDRVRLRVPARDVILSRDAPGGISALNVLPVKIAAMSATGGAHVDVALHAGTDRLLARITKRSARGMALAEGQDLFAIVKATAVSG